MLEAAGQALVILLDPYRMMMLSGGVMMGLVLGIIPGLSGLVGMALLLPFTFHMDPYTALAVLLGMSAVTGSSDTIPAVLFGVPGTSAAQATIMDGNPMARNGEAGRALSAAYTASLIGGLIGALLLAVSLPVLRPIILYIGSPELLALTIFGISMVASLSGNAPLLGLATAGFGILMSMVGSDPQTGTMRWTLGTVYLFNGLPLIPLVLGVFALPEVADLAIRRMAIAEESKYDVRRGMLKGATDAVRNWWLVIRSGAMGAGIGAIPGLGASVVDWIVYGHAMQTCKGAHNTFGKGDVRGVIAPEAANNSITAGALVPTIAFGVPGSASMAILLGAFLVHGLVPGPSMLTQHLDVTYTIVWSVAIANILGAGVLFLFSGQLAKIALLRYTLILPTVLAVVYIGSFQASRAWGDLYTLLLFGLIGWTMKHMRWPRPPLILGFVLGSIIERYMFISISRYGFEWFSRPIVIALLLLALLSLVHPLMRHLRVQGGMKGTMASLERPVLRMTHLFYTCFIGIVGWMLVEASDWQFRAMVGPTIVGSIALAAAGISFLFSLFSGAGEPGSATLGTHMDTASDHSGLPLGTVLFRAAAFFSWLVFFMLSMALVGTVLTIPLFVILYMRLEGKERWALVLPQAVLLTAAVYVIFDRFLNLPWPPTYLGYYFPALRFVPGI